MREKVSKNHCLEIFSLVMDSKSKKKKKINIFFKSKVFGDNIIEKVSEIALSSQKLQHFQLKLR